MPRRVALPLLAVQSFAVVVTPVTVAGLLRPVAVIVLALCVLVLLLHPFGFEIVFALRFLVPLLHPFGFESAAAYHSLPLERKDDG